MNCRDELESLLFVTLFLPGRWINQCPDIFCFQTLYWITFWALHVL